MPFGPATRTDLLQLMLQATALPVAWTGTLYVSLHTADPAGGNQSTSEIAYTNYARVAVARTAGGWSVATPTGSNAAIVTFPTCGVTGGNINYVGLGLASSGAGQLIASGAAVGAPVAVAANQYPFFAIGALTLTLT